MVRRAWVLSTGPFLQSLNRQSGREGATATSSLPLGAASPGMGSKGRGWPAPSRNPKPVSLWRRGRAGATQAPNGFQAPTLKAVVGSRLSSCPPFHQPSLVLSGGWGKKESSGADGL